MDMLTTTEVATLLGVSQPTVWRLIDSGALPSVRLDDKSWHRIQRSQLEKFAQSRGMVLDWTLIDKQ